jgi:hypothetical protein
MTEQKLRQAQQVFESAAGTSPDAVHLLGEGLAILAAALIEISNDIERLKTTVDQKPKR